MAKPDTSNKNLTLVDQGYNGPKPKPVKPKPADVKLNKKMKQQKDAYDAARAQEDAFAQQQAQKSKVGRYQTPAAKAKPAMKPKRTGRY